MSAGHMENQKAVAHLEVQLKMAWLLGLFALEDLVEHWELYFRGEFAWLEAGKVPELTSL